MPKRHLPSQPAPRQKRVKCTSNQSIIDHFFSSTSRPINNAVTEFTEHSDCGPDVESETGRVEAEWKKSTDTGLPQVIDIDLDTNNTVSPSSPTFLHGLSNESESIKSKQPEIPGTPSRVMRCTAEISKPPIYKSLSLDPLVFLVDNSPWPSNSPVPYSFLVHTLAALSETRSRIAIINILTNALRTITEHHPSSLLPAIYLLSNTLSPPYSPLELGLGPSVISKAIQHVSGLTPSALKRLYTTTGDVGDMAFEAKSKLRTLVPHPPLLVIAVYDALLKIAHEKGQGAFAQKQKIVEKLLVAAKGEETRFLARTLSQNLRVGAVRASILTALARAMVLTRPCDGNFDIPEDSSYHATPDLLIELSLVSKSGKKKGVGQARDAIKSKFDRAENLIKTVFIQHPNYEHIVTALLRVGLDGLADGVPLTVGIPLHPMLGSPIRSLGEIYDRLGDLPFTAEFKYDGQRAQIHASKTKNGLVSVRLFSRHLEDMTSKYPDVVSLIDCMCESSPQTSSFILDAEIVAVDPVDGSLKSFQQLSNRARKDVQLQNIQVAVAVFAFDLMYLDGEILLERPFRERRSLLRSRFHPFVPKQNGLARFGHVESCESEDGRILVEEFWERAITSRCEGLMVKLLDSEESLEGGRNTSKSRRKLLNATYEADKRTFAWMKLKKDYVAGLGDSFDLIPIGGWHGNGRKAQWWSPILLGLWDPDCSQIVAVCKCMSGFTDVFYKALKERYPLAENSDTCSRQPIWGCDTGNLKPEVYFKPQEIWEVRGADITLSPVSSAALGLVSQSRGLSLRFPRFVRVREDKVVEQASTPKFLANIWRSQQTLDQPRRHDDDELVDFDYDSAREDEDEDEED